MNKFLIIIFIALAGPVIGSFFGVWKKYSAKQINYLLSFAAGVMIAVSVFQLLPESIRSASGILVLTGLISGALLMLILNKTLPHFHILENCENNKQGMVNKTIVFIFLGISIHNMPEGAAIGIGALADFKFSLVIALAIALHDIPEAICISAPFYYATGNRLKALTASALTALPTAAGAILAYYLLGEITHIWLGTFMGFTAGVMLYISFFEILPFCILDKAGRKMIALSLAAGMFLVLALQALLESGWV